MRRLSSIVLIVALAGASRTFGEELSTEPDVTYEQMIMISRHGLSEEECSQRLLHGSSTFSGECKGLQIWLLSNHNSARMAAAKHCQDAMTRVWPDCLWEPKRDPVR